MRLLLLVIPVGLLTGQTPNAPIDNEFVRVLSVTDQPVAKPGSLHEHKQNRVMIYLDSGDIQIKYADGKVENQHWKAGDVAWSPAGGMHTSQNVSASPVRIVEIEVRSAGGKSASAWTGAVPLVDNPQVRVYRAAKPAEPANKGAVNYVAVDARTAAVLWNRVPGGDGPFIIAEIK